MTTVTVKINASANDGYTEGNSTDYSDAHQNAVSASDGVELYIGQDYISDKHIIRRAFLKFDTTSIPSNAEIQSASLYLYGLSDYSTEDFTIRLQKWTGDTPIDTDDHTQYDGVNYDDGTFNTQNFVVDGWNEIVISNFNLIEKEGYTKICVRHDKDVSETPSSAQSSVRVGSYDWGEDYAPYLEITYTVPTVTVEISASGDDGLVYGESDSYSTAHDTATGSDSTGKYLNVGQQSRRGIYSIVRTFLKFDTTSIPTNAVIESASLYLYGYSDPPTKDFKIRLQKWTGDTPIGTEDYTQYDGVNYDDGTFDTSGMVLEGWNEIKISNFDLIEKGGYTKICVRSEDDINHTPPAQAEENDVAMFYSYDGNHPPYLEITYTTAAPPPKHPITHLDKGPHPRSRMTFYPRLSL